jgi:hypothetical protein
MLNPVEKEGGSEEAETQRPIEIPDPYTMQVVAKLLAVVGCTFVAVVVFLWPFAQVTELKKGV